MTQIPFRIEDAGGQTYVVHDGGDRAKPIEKCTSEVASVVVLVLWDELKQADARLVEAMNELNKGKVDYPAAAEAAATPPGTKRRGGK